MRLLLTVEDLTLDTRSHQVALETLMRHAGEVVSRTYLGEHVWEDEHDSLYRLGPPPR